MNRFLARARHLRLLLWLALLLVVALAAQATIVAHRARVRGIPGAFPKPVAEAAVPMLGVNVALDQYDDEALEAFSLLGRLEGIVPALEPAHAIAVAVDKARQMKPDRALVVNLSGRGDKDVEEAARLLAEARGTGR